jgi:hypothetical protein
MKKLVNRKNILKEAGVLLVAAILVLTAIAIPGQSTQMNIKENNTTATWLSSAKVKVNLPDKEGNSYLFEPDKSILQFSTNWLHYDNGIVDNGVGLTDGGRLEWGIRLTPTELSPYVGCDLTTVKFYHGWTGSAPITHSGNIHVYQQGTSTTPGPEITSATTPWTNTGPGWVVKTLTNSVTITTPLQDLWVTIDVTTHSPGEYPAGRDSGPATVGKGDFLYFGGTWYELSSFGWDYNWNVWAGVDCINNPPVADDDYYSVCYGSTTTFDVLVNDGDPDGDPIFVSDIPIPPSSGTATIVGGGTAIQYNPGTFFGTEQFTYEIDDGNGGTDTAIVTVDVCCVEIVDIRMHPTNPNYIQVEIKNHCGMDLIRWRDRLQLTWDFTVDPVAPCCGGTGSLTDPPWNAGAGVYRKTNRLPLRDGNSGTRNCMVKGNAFFTLKLTVLVPPTGCSCEKIVTGCVSNLQLC